MIHRQKEAWKKLIEGKIAQEEGREEAGLKAFEQALEIEPNNEHFREACAAAREKLCRTLSRSEEDLLAQVKTSYEQFTASLPSEKLERVDGFTAILAKLEGRHNPMRTYMRGLRS